MNGQLGHELNNRLNECGDVIALDRASADLSKWDKVKLALDKYQPDIVFNAAAYTAVDEAEEEQGLAYLVNAETPGKIAEYCKKESKLLIHYSTDYVFSGEENAPHDEESQTDPLNVYGASKALGEKLIIESGCGYFILRTSWVYALRGHNFIKTMQGLAEQRASLKVIGDQFSSPTSAECLADHSVALLKKAIVKKEETQQWPKGLYHACSSDHTSWHGLACAALSLLRPKFGQSWALKSETDIESIPSEGFPLPAKRPLDSRMSPSLLEKDWGLKMPSWESQLALCFKPWLD